ncbi:MAG: metal ABC transporter ATP-binding protein [Candidatus Sericytochromatia bacterium]|nr:metal ABC transporter ATP-binding protein [Candidatus Sericytochromatia bacterium]
MTQARETGEPEALATTSLSAGYPGHPVLEGVTLRLPLGRLVGVLGPNGAGKSTLLKAILGLLPISRGRVSVLGGTCQQAGHRLAYVPQRNAVDWDFPATVLDVVLMGRYAHTPWWRPASRADRQAAREALARVGLLDLADRRIGELSGGQQQRVFLARALAQEATLYLLDEPLAGVDVASEAVIMRELRAIRDAGGGVVVVHHDLHTAPAYFDHVVLLNRRLVASGPTAEVFVPDLLATTYGVPVRAAASEPSALLRQE